MPTYSLQGGWTKGKLNCPNCQAKIGGFDFVAGAQYPVHIVKSKVDLWTKPKPLEEQTMLCGSEPSHSSKEDLQSSPSIGEQS